MTDKKDRNGNVKKGTNVFKLPVSPKEKKVPGKMIPGAAGGDVGLYDIEYPVDSTESIVQAFWSPEWLMICNIEDHEKRERQARKYLSRMAKNNDLYGLRLYVVNLTGRIEKLEEDNRKIVSMNMTMQSILGDADAICKALYEPFWKRWFKLFIVRVARNRIKKQAKKNAKKFNSLSKKETSKGKSDLKSKNEEKGNESETKD